MSNILCDNCRKDSGIEASGRRGTDMARVQNLGWVSKMLMLYTQRPDDAFIVCSSECAKVVQERVFAEAGVTPARIAEINVMLAESKKKIPAMAAETARAAGAFQQALLELTKGRSKR